jgi:PBSX family phage terminase large subunit
MANEGNLIPIEHLTKDEAKKRGSAGGKASVAARRRKKNMKDCMKMLLGLKATDAKTVKAIEALGVEDGEAVTNTLAIAAALMNRAQRGDVAAIKEVRSIIGDDERLKLDRERFELERKKAFPDKPEKPKYSGIPANLIAPAFASVHFSIAEREYLEYIFPGGRGSTKSSFCALEVVDILMQTDDLHAVCLRRYSNTLKDSVFSKIKWAITSLGLEAEFEFKVSPMEITKKSTGQKIYFRGADDPDKIKSIAPEFGYIGIAWFEELDQFEGAEAVRNITQSIIRGGDNAYIFKSFNPPKSAHNWANKYVKIPRADRLVTESTYLTVPKKWLGKPFLDEAEHLRETNPTAYENEYGGVANGSGGNVFDNVTIRAITDEEIGEFDRIYHGVDWGWFPDPWAYNKMHYDAARHRLYIFGELHGCKLTNEQTADKLMKSGIGQDLVTCDSAEPKSVGDYRAAGILARAAEKGPGSVEYSMKWLQSLSDIIIDNVRCPETAGEFLDYEYERDREGEIITGYPDKNNHHIDAVRYAMNTVWKRRGE